MGSGWRGCVHLWGCTSVQITRCTNRHHSRLACLLGAPEKTPRRGFGNSFVAGMSDLSMSASGMDARAASSAFCLGVRSVSIIIFMIYRRRCQLGRGLDLAATCLPSERARPHQERACGPARFLDGETAESRHVHRPQPSPNPPPSMRLPGYVRLSDSTTRAYESVRTPEAQSPGRPRCLRTTPSIHGRGGCTGASRVSGTCL